MLTSGGIVRLEVGLWAMGVDFDAGESIYVQVGGRIPSIAEFAAWSKRRWSGKEDTHAELPQQYHSAFRATLEGA